LKVNKFNKHSEIALTFCPFSVIKKNKHKNGFYLSCLENAKKDAVLSLVHQNPLKLFKINIKKRIEKEKSKKKEKRLFIERRA